MARDGAVEVELFLVHGALDYKNALKNSLSSDELKRTKIIRDNLNHHSVLFSELSVNGEEFLYATAKDSQGLVRAPNFNTDPSVHPFSFWDIEHAFYSLAEWDAILHKLVINL